MNKNSEKYLKELREKAQQHRNGAAYFTNGVFYAIDFARKELDLDPFEVAQDLGITFGFSGYGQYDQMSDMAPTEFRDRTGG